MRHSKLASWLFILDEEHKIAEDLFQFARREELGSVVATGRRETTAISPNQLVVFATFFKFSMCLALCNCKVLIVKLNTI